MNRVLKVCGIVFLCLISFRILMLVFSGDDKKVSQKNISGAGGSWDENWEYKSDTDKMTNNVVYYARIEAKEKLQLKFPYQGGSIAAINIRYKDGEPTAYIHISKGQLIAAHAGKPGEIRVRFDQEPADKYEVVGAIDYSPNYLFIDHAAYFIKKLKTSKSLLIETEVYDNGVQQMEFNTSDLVWNH